MQSEHKLEEIGAFKTLEQFIIEQQGTLDHSTGAFSRLLRDISVAAKLVNWHMRRAGIVDVFGKTGEINVQGEVQQVMDLLAHKEFVRALKRGGECCLIGSEEHSEAIPIRAGKDNKGKYIVLLDPLDGSSNIEVNVSVGTIFSIYHLPDHMEEATLDAALQPGVEQIGAGYVVYGSSTVLVYTTGQGVNGFTLDPSIGEFLLTHPDITTPRYGGMYSVNEGNYQSFELGLKKYIKWMQQERPEDGRPLSTRYFGSFVADFHRNLLMGGLYIYPATHKNKSGKLRLMYEANPLAFIAEQAGGAASTGTGRIMEVIPEKLHQRIPLYIGSLDMVRNAESFLAGERGID
ncbi:MAG TPA: class 1 fructose-bisphosphatase [Bacteroidetes bacterium]|nr:class 1 fructose-bisphosphatase [Bacteroidota bacterium]